MSVDTNTVGKNLSPYTVVRRAGIKVLVAPSLVGFADEVHLAVGGRVRKRLRVDIDHVHGPHCRH